MTTPDKEEMPTDMTAAKLIRWPDTANIGVTEANGDIVWWAQISTLNPNTSVADLRNVADRIVTACNAYEPTREALKPFADELNDYPVDIDGSTRIWDCKIRVRDLRNAAAAYAALSTLPVNDRHHSGSDSYQADASAPALSEKVNVRSESRDER